MQIRYQMPQEMRDQVLAARSIMDKAEPFLKKKARQNLGLPPEDDGEDQDDDDD